MHQCSQPMAGHPETVLSLLLPRWRIVLLRTSCYSQQEYESCQRIEYISHITPVLKFWNFYCKRLSGYTFIHHCAYRRPRLIQVILIRNFHMYGRTLGRLKAYTGIERTDNTIHLLASFQIYHIDRCSGISIHCGKRINRSAKAGREISGDGYIFCNTFFAFTL